MADAKVQSRFDNGIYKNGGAGLPADPIMHEFKTGATRSAETGKLDYEGFYSPLVVLRFAEYMNVHRVQADGGLRESDNWTKGMNRRRYVKSLWRHMMDVWLTMRGFEQCATTQDLEEALCACLFNVQGLLHEVLVKRDIE